MPAGDFAPNGAAPGKDTVHVIKDKTLKELKYKTEFEANDFDVQAGPDSRKVSLKGGKGGWSGDAVIFSCAETEFDHDLPMKDWPLRMILRLTIRDGSIVSVNDTFEKRPESKNIKIAYVQDCHFIDDPPGDDWRTGG